MDRPLADSSPCQGVIKVFSRVGCSGAAELVRVTQASQSDGPDLRLSPAAHSADSRPKPVWRTGWTVVSKAVAGASVIGLLCLGALRTYLTEFYRQLGVSLDDVQVASSGGGALFWSAVSSIGVVALIIAFGWFGVIIRRSWSARWQSVSSRPPSPQRLRDWLLNAAPALSLVVALLVKAPLPLAGLLASCCLVIWLSSTHRSQTAARGAGPWLSLAWFVTTVFIAVTPWLVSLLPQILSSADGLDPSSWTQSRLTVVVFVVVFTIFTHILATGAPGRVLPLWAFGLEGLAGVLLLGVVMWALAVPDGDFVLLAGVVGFSYTMGVLLGDPGLLPRTIAPLARQATPAVIMGLVALFVLVSAVVQLQEAARQGAALKATGEMPSSRVLSENVHFAAIAPVDGDPLGICDASTTAVTISGGATPFVLVRRMGSEPFTAVLPDEYVVMRALSEQRGCLRAPS